jgi:hypothetical protein
MIYLGSKHFINLSFLRASLDESITPIFTHFIVGYVKNVFTRCRTTTSAVAGDEKMRRKTSKNWSVNSASTEFHHQGSQYSNNASNQSAETAYKLNERQCVVNPIRIAFLTTKREQEQETQWDYQTYLTSRFMRLKMILGRSPELVELYNAGFTQEEIDLMESLTDLEEWEPISAPGYRPRQVIMT